MRVKHEFQAELKRDILHFFNDDNSKTFFVQMPLPGSCQWAGVAQLLEKNINDMGVAS